MVNTLRKYDIKGLTLLAANVADQLKTVRSIRVTLNSDLADLNSSAAKKKYTVPHLTQRKSDIRRDALGRIRNLNHEIAEWSKPASLERHEWSRESLLASTDSGVDALRKEDRLMARVENSIRRLELSTRLSRLNDDALGDYALRQSQVRDTLGLVMCAEESAIRGGLVNVKCQQLLASVECPEADKADEIYNELARDLSEAAAIEEHIERPDNEMAYARMRSAEIGRSAAKSTAEDGSGDKKTKSEATDTHFAQHGGNGDFEPKPAA